jgi:hypothetical protein
MKVVCSALCVAIFAAPFVAGCANTGSSAGSEAEQPSAAAADEKGCDSVNWGQEVLTKFPNAHKACQGVMMRNGEAYAHYIAKVVANEEGTMTVHLIDKAKTPISEIVFVPNPEQTVTIEGRPTKQKDLKEGTTLDLYIQHNRWGLYSDPAGTPMNIVSRRDL